MYRGRLWTMRQYAGMGDAEESNRRYKFLLANGTTGLSVAFDLPTQIGYDSDVPMALGEVGKVGVAIDSIEDMERLFDGIPLDRISTSMTINATATILLALYVAVARRTGRRRKLSGTVQNDILKEYIARGTYIYPVRHAMRIVTDIFAWARRGPAGVEHHLHLRLPHARGRIDRRAGGRLHPRQRHGLRSGRGRRRPRDRSLRAAPVVLLQRAQQLPRGGRQVPRPPAGCGPASCATASAQENPRSWMLRFHTQTAGSTLTAQQPENNIVRTAIQALSAVLGGTQSLHTNGYDEALALPTEEAARIALRTQQIIASESGVAQTIDPFAGSLLRGALTNNIEQQARAYLDRIETLGGMLRAIERGWVQQEIQNAAYEYQRAVDTGEATVVGVNRFTREEEPEIPIQRIDESLERKQVERVRALRARRDPQRWQSHLIASATTPAAEPT